MLKECPLLQSFVSKECSIFYSVLSKMFYTYKCWASILHSAVSKECPILQSFVSKNAPYFKAFCVKCSELKRVVSLSFIKLCQKNVLYMYFKVMCQKNVLYFKVFCLKCSKLKKCCVSILQKAVSKEWSILKALGQKNAVYF